MQLCAGIAPHKVQPGGHEQKLQGKQQQCQHQPCHHQGRQHRVHLAKCKPAKAPGRTSQGTKEDSFRSCPKAKASDCCMLEVSGLHLGQQQGNRIGHQHQLQQAPAEQGRRQQREEQRDQATRKRPEEMARRSLPPNTCEGVQNNRRNSLASGKDLHTGVGGVGHTKTMLTQNNVQDARPLDLHVKGKVFMPSH
jgi:hypothetical protein